MNRIACCVPYCESQYTFREASGKLVSLKCTHFCARIVSNNLFDIEIEDVPSVEQEFIIPYVILCGMNNQINKLIAQPIRISLYQCFKIDEFNNNNKKENLVMWNLTVELGSAQSISAFVIGMVQAVLLIVYNIPNAVKIHKMKDPNIVSKKSMIIQYMLQILSLAYGALLEEIPLLVANIGSLSVLLTISILKGMYRTNNKFTQQIKTNQEAESI